MEKKKPIEYDCVYSCNKCGGANEFVIQDSIENTPSEYTTKCIDCGFIDYWCTGFFESRTDDFNASEKYSF